MQLIEYRLPLPLKYQEVSSLVSLHYGVLLDRYSAIIEEEYSEVKAKKGITPGPVFASQPQYAEASDSFLLQARGATRFFIIFCPPRVPLSGIWFRRKYRCGATPELSFFSPRLE
jgi:hypothetical protein